MNGTRSGMGWGARLLVALVLLLAGAAAAIWGLAHYQPAVRLLGIAPPQQPVMLTPKPVATGLASGTAQQPSAPPPDSARVAELESRIDSLQNATQRAEGFAGRADALVVAFAARRAVDRGVALGYLEPLLVERFAGQHRAAVATIITNSRQPVRLSELIEQYRTLGPDLRSGGPQDSWWTNFKRELGTLVEVHRAERPATNPEARYNRALQQLSAGDVDQALAETMRLPGAERASDWTNKARRYIGSHRALDEIEFAALLTGTGPSR